VTVTIDGFAPVRRLGPGDLPRCVALAGDRGWSPERAKWSLLLEACEVFGVDAPDGPGLAGTVVLTQWQRDLAAVGMMVVAARYGRRGLGRALMEHLLRAAGEHATVTLFATDMGRPLYDTLGFVPVRRSVSFVGWFRPGPPRLLRSGADRPGKVRPASEADWPAIASLDQAAFGADRGRILRRLPGFADQVAVLEDGTGAGGPQITGYGAAWRNGPAVTVIGPVVAPSDAAARQLIAKLAARARTPVRLDLDPDRPGLPGWAAARGLEPVGRTVVMARGANPPRGLPEHLFAPISVALA
jgi:GNAT superfamily N-acetyltransferase